VRSNSLSLVGLILLMVVGGTAASARGAPQSYNQTDAVVLYREAFALLPATNQNPTLLTQEPDQVQLDPGTIKFIQEHEPALAILRRAAAVKSANWGADSRNGGAIFNERREQISNAAWLLEVRSRWLVDQKRFDDAFEDAATQIAMARHFGQTPWFLMKLSRRASRTPARERPLGSWPSPRPRH